MGTSTGSPSSSGAPSGRMLPQQGTAGGSGASPTTTGGIGGRQPGMPSAVGPSSREEELRKRGEALEMRAKRGVCQGC